ncbi:MAG: sugar phosphate isomerase/epimerase family protein [Burkholderiales bacterium]
MNPLAIAPTTVPDALPLDYLDAAIASGCEAIGLRLHRSPNLPFHPVVGDARLIREMKARLIDARLPTLDIFTFYLQPACDFDQFTRSLALGADFGARFALVQGDDADRVRLGDTFARFCDLAASFEMTSVVEFNPARSLATFGQALELIETAGKSNAAICVDPLHLARSGGAPSDLHGTASRLLPYAQFSDGRLDPVERLLPGEGSLPLRDLLDVLPAKTTLSVEVPMPGGSRYTIAEWVRLVIETTRAFLVNERATPPSRPMI